jgi:PTH1 family peptidyl-tRNA hydrolase
VKLIVGLGNPGTRYERTRHNVGYRVVDELAREERAGAWSARSLSLVCEIVIAEQPVWLAKPLTYMNASGRAVRALLEDARLDPKDLILVLDEWNLPLGKIRIRERGSAGGHNGMDSIIRTLDSEEMIRVRLGIGQENMPEEKSGFVLADFPPDRAVKCRDMISRGAQAVRCIVAEGASRAMSVFNA